ncbi:DUF4365 domain-containing protein [Pseudomonas syringae group genomosp. 3]|uniref:DUF4365 domain-containing protein n=1 Tax=Pseudomonas syringae group genomosp. 3 TaxID=251701 RepID=UPI000EFF68FF|nr:DUF4365 domain-containing protein [Pseudomonas syringae group genomosp. 3]
MSKQYPKRSINGDAGEHFVAFKFTRTLNWPCRLQEIDLGIDAEIEICDDSNGATGNVVKLQIKSFEKMESPTEHSVYVSDADISYWQRFSVPTIVVCVDLTTEKVYWKSISLTEAYRSAGVSRKITFDLANDELKPDARAKIAELSSPEHFKDVGDIIAAAEAIYSKVKSSDVFGTSEDELTFIHEANDEFDLLVSRIEEIRRHYPWRISPFTAVRIEQMKSNMYRHQNNAEVSYRNGVNGM